MESKVCFDVVLSNAKKQAEGKETEMKAIQVLGCDAPQPDIKLERRLAEELAEMATMPARKESARRDSKITLVCYAWEKTKILENAEEMGLALSDYIRQSTLTNCLLQRRDNDISSASLSTLGQLRAILMPAMATLQGILRDMPESDERKQLVAVAKSIDKAISKIDSREERLACSPNI